MSNKGRSSALTKPVKVSKELALIVNSDFLPRTEIVKAVWKYIKDNGRQKESNKKIIVPDKTLSAVLGSEEINMFDMNSKLKHHIFSV
ncbi:MAG: hypothetical protein KAH32_01245 [Chlamydiia bacterium]|nr:hypothetical protein [Chlamydiia bacterium]